MEFSGDNGPAFERRALAMARSIHDPLGLQGATMILGRERDSVFVGDDSIHVYEFTVGTTKAKAEKDAEKLAEALAFMSRDPANKFKTRTGWFVTRDEPTAEQRDVVRKIALRSQCTIHAISYQALRSRLCNVESYLASRGQAPFGSVAYTRNDSAHVIAPRFHDASSSSSVLSLRQLVDAISDGERALLLGEFGVGKSQGLKAAYDLLRKLYFKDPSARRFPLHVNLRDCVGLRSPAEVLRRHAEEVGFADDRGLISAWRAGACVLLLDGFDEVIPSRWLGSVTTLREIRWEALAPVRRLISEAPEGVGVLVAGRGHYFSSQEETCEALGLPAGSAYRLHDFDLDQASEFLAKNGSDAVLPDWLPTKPLLLVHLLQSNALTRLGELNDELDPSRAWRGLLSMICQRESKIYASVPPGTIKRVLQRLATVARMKGDPMTALARSDLERVFVDVSGRSTDEEVLQLLLRLPGLAVGADSNQDEVRVFADEDLADTAYGEDFAEYLSSPFQGHPLIQGASWSEAGSSLSVEVCAAALQDISVTPKQVLAAADFRMNQNLFDTVLFDALRVADEMDAEAGTTSYIVEGVLVRSLSIGPESAVIGRTHLRDCLVDELEMAAADSLKTCPTFEKCLIEVVDGVQQIPPSLQSKFEDSEITRFTGPPATSAGLLALTSSIEDRVALSVLHKVYAKRGSGRKDSALPRGLDPASQAVLPQVVSVLTSNGYLSTASRGNVTIYLPVKGKRARVVDWLSHPQTFVFSHL